jgi:sugar O-acyltransferase (sialic acid O-acetyltransferase NeuD family)
MSFKDLILVGGGGHARACADVISTIKKYNIKGYVDPKINKAMAAYNYLGTDDVLSEYIDNSFFIIAIGQIKSYSKRKELFDYLKKNKAKIITVESNNSYVSKNSNIGIGTIIMHGVIIQTDVKIGENCTVNDKALIEHDVTIGNNCHISTGSIINGNVKIGNGVFIGSGAIIKNDVSIANNCIIGMGAIIKNDIVEENRIIKK